MRAVEMQLKSVGDYPCVRLKANKGKRKKIDAHMQVLFRLTLRLVRILFVLFLLVYCLHIFCWRCGELFVCLPCLQLCRLFFFLDLQFSSKFFLGPVFVNFLHVSFPTLFRLLLHWWIVMVIFISLFSTLFRPLMH